MDGGFCLNEWLVREGYLTFKEDIPRDGQLISFEKLTVDWQKTQAWGAGGYYGRLFLNVAGREPEGVIPQSDYNSLRDEIARKLNALTDHQGNLLQNICYKPEEIYKEVNNVAPDLIIYFGDLYSGVRSAL